MGNLDHQLLSFFRHHLLLLLLFDTADAIYELVIEIYAPHVRLPNLATLSVLLPFTTLHVTLAHKMLVTRRPSVTSSKHRLLGKLRACRADWDPAHTVFFATLVDLLSDKTPSRNSRSFRGTSTGSSSGSRTYRPRPRSSSKTASTRTVVPPPSRSTAQPAQT
jgi:hypothetical protein